MTEGREPGDEARLTLYVLVTSCCDSHPTYGMETEDGMDRSVMLYSNVQTYCIFRSFMVVVYENIGTGDAYINNPCRTVFCLGYVMMCNRRQENEFIISFVYYDNNLSIQFSNLILMIQYRMS